jgi:SagB-type dehydrogenase family enzyme
VRERETFLELPAPRLDSPFSLEKAIARRRSVRGYAEGQLSLSELSQLLWAAQGITSEPGLRAAASAGATYPLEVYVIVGAVAGLETGIYRYDCKENRLSPVRAGDQRRALASAARGQSSLEDAPLTIALTAIYARTAGRYGARATRYVDMEAGHASQNIYLQAAALGLGTVAVGAFDDGEVARVLDAGKDEVPLYLMPVGRLA